MKVCLVRSPSLIGKTAVIAPLTPAIGLAYMAAYLREAGHYVTIIDGVGEAPQNSIPYSDFLILRGIGIDEIVKRIPSDTNLIGITEMFSSQWTLTRSLVNAIGKAFPDVFMVGGGEHFTALPDLSLKQCPDLDACVIGEGEETTVDLVNILEKGESLKNVNGLVIRNSDGTVKTAPRGRIRVLDNIPLPAWDLFPLRNYLDDHLGFGVDLGRSMPMLASRGCPYQCTFCSNSLMWGTRWVARNPIKVVDEIEQYVEKYQIDNVDFYDLTAIVKRKWIIDFCNELINRNINITWQLPSGTRSEAIDEEVAKLLYQSGCRNLSYAPESGSERMRIQIKKKINLDQLVKSLRGSIREGLSVKINIIIGFPDESNLSIWKTFWFIIRLSWYGAQDVGVSPFFPSPGSELCERLVNEGKIVYSDEFFDTLCNSTLTKTVSYCEAISDRWLGFYTVFGFLLFYGTNYIFRPQRFYRTIRNLITNNHESRGEMALYNMLKRMNLVPKVKS